MHEEYERNGNEMKILCVQNEGPRDNYIKQTPVRTNQLYILLHCYDQSHK